MFGLDTKSLIVGIILGWFLLPMLLGLVTSKMGAGKGAKLAAA